MLLNDVRLRLEDGFDTTGRVVGTITDLATNVAVDYPADLLPGDALDQVEDVAAEYLRWDLLLVGQVAAARCAGVSWAAIGQAVGMSRDGARKRFGSRIGEV